MNETIDVEFMRHGTNGTEGSLGESKRALLENSTFVYHLRCHFRPGVVMSV